MDRDAVILSLPTKIDNLDHATDNAVRSSGTASAIWRAVQQWDGPSR